MRWIGYHIWNFITRFRNDVYLEDVQSGTIASGGNLGLDSNNKIVKQSDTGITDLHGAGVDGSANQLLTDDGDGTVTSEPNLTFDGSTLTLTGDITATGDTFTFQSANADDPQFIIKNTTADNQGARLQLRKDRGAAMADLDRIGEIDFFGEDASQNTQQYAKIQVQAIETDHGSETSKMQLQVAEYDGNVRTGLLITGKNSDGRIDVDLGSGASSVTTVGGTLTMGSTAALNNTGEIQVASQPSITTLAGVSAIGSAGTPITITSDTVNFTSTNADDPAIWIKNTANDSQATRMLFLKERGADGQDGDECGAIYFYSYDDGTPSLQKYGYIESTIHDATSGQESGKLDIGVSNHNGSANTGISMQGGSLAGEVDVTIASGTSSVTTISGSLNVTNDYQSEVFENKFAEDNGVGEILKYSPGGEEMLNPSEIYFLHTDGTWNQADADAVATGASQMLGVAQGNGNSQEDGVFIRGFIRIASTEILNTPGSGAVDGLPLYVSTTPGHFDFTAPSASGDFVRIVGYAIDDSGGDVLIYFDPDKTWVEIS